MSFTVLLDENFPRSVAEGLLASGHDVLTVAQASPGLNDRSVLALARTTGRWLLTFDSDFGDLIFQHGEAPAPAILYFRLHPIVVGEVLAAARRALTADNLGCFTVVTREGVRRRPLPPLIGDAGR